MNYLLPFFFQAEEVEDSAHYDQFERSPASISSLKSKLSTTVSVVKKMEELTIDTIEEEVVEMTEDEQNRDEVTQEMSETENNDEVLSQVLTVRVKLLPHPMIFPVQQILLKPRGGVKF